MIEYICYNEVTNVSWSVKQECCEIRVCIYNVTHGLAAQTLVAQ